MKARLPRAHYFGDVRGTIGYKNPFHVRAGLKGSAKGFQRYSRANYQDLGPIMERIAEGRLVDPWTLELAVFLQSEQRKSSRRARAQLYKLLRMGR